jgi:hypothetical protein
MSFRFRLDEALHMTAVTFTAEPAGTRDRRGDSQPRQEQRNDCGSADCVNPFHPHLKQYRTTPYFVTAAHIFDSFLTSGSLMLRMRAREMWKWL